MQLMSNQFYEYLLLVTKLLSDSEVSSDLNHIHRYTRASFGVHRPPTGAKGPKAITILLHTGGTYAACT